MAFIYLIKKSCLMLVFKYYNFLDNSIIYKMGDVIFYLCYYLRLEFNKFLWVLDRGCILNVMNIQW